MTRALVVVAGIVALAATVQPTPMVAQQPVPGAAIDFAFRGERSTWVPADIVGDGTAFEVRWPAAAGSAWDTALLSIGVATPPVQPEVDATPSPYIEITLDGYSDRQYFRAGESGPRWLNLSHLRGSLASGTPVRLRAEGLSLGTGRTALRLFAARPDLSTPVLVLAPHPDDAEIAAFGLYATTDSTVVTVTAGNAGSPTYESVFGEQQDAEQYHYKGRVRVIDSVTIPWQGSVPPERALNLGYFDARLAAMYEQPAVVVPEMYGPNSDISVYRRYNISSRIPRESRSSTWNNLVEDMESLLREVDPGVIAAPHPQLDDHRDHQFTTVALVEAMSRWNEDVTLLLYTNHADGNRYPYGPAGTLMSLPAISAPVELDRVFSLAVPPDTQRDKLFALESMHDLRYSPTRQYQLALGNQRTVAAEKEGPGPDISYLRRGPRSNEMFFVYDQDTVQPMMDAFLAPWRGKRVVN